MPRENHLRQREEQHERNGYPDPDPERMVAQITEDRSSACWIGQEQRKQNQRALCEWGEHPIWRLKRAQAESAPLSDDSADRTFCQSRRPLLILERTRNGVHVLAAVQRPFPRKSQKLSPWGW